MISFAEAIQQKEKELNIQNINEIVNITKFKSQRAEIISELYDGYLADNKLSNWKGYITWLKANRIKHSKEQVVKFKESTSYYKEMSIKRFLFFLAHIPTNDLFYLKSIMKDKQARKENFSKWLFWSLKCKD